MLVYHPFFDPYHCTFRLLCLINRMDLNQSVELDRIRAWDFYLLFPTALKDATLPGSSARKMRKLLNTKYEAPYELLPDHRIIVERLRPIQHSALAHLASRNIINAKELKAGRVLKGEVSIPQNLALRVEKINLDDNELISFLTHEFLEIPLYGQKGIRQRTDLFDCRYDPT